MCCGRTSLKSFGTLAIERLSPQRRRQPDGTTRDFASDSEILARPIGIEPTTFGSGGQRSIQLSYGRVLADEHSITQSLDCPVSA